MTGAYTAALVAGTRRSLRQPGELLVRVAFYAVILVVFSALWRASVAANHGRIESYDFRAMIWYTVAAEAAVIATKPRMIEEIGDDIGSGAIAVDMLRPVSVVGFRLAAELGEASIRLVAALLVGSVMIGATVGPPPEVSAALLSLPALVLAVACNLAAQHAFAAIAFWVEDAKGAWFLYQKLVFLLGGMLLPVELFPGWLEGATRVLPFIATAYVPGRLLAGHAEWSLLLLQAGWLVVLTGMAFVSFGAGERRLEVAGG